MEQRRATLLRIAFLAGAVTDALALVPMLSPGSHGPSYSSVSIATPVRLLM